MYRLIFMILIVAVIAWLIHQAVRQYSTLFRIEVQDKRFELKGTIPGHAWSDVRTFLATLPLPGRCHIEGARDELRFRLAFSGNIDEGTKQRIRNFLYLS
jgi:hypothetical protein